MWSVTKIEPGDELLVHYEHEMPRAAVGGGPRLARLQETAAAATAAAAALAEEDEEKEAAPAPNHVDNPAEFFADYMSKLRGPAKKRPRI